MKKPFHESGLKEYQTPSVTVRQYQISVPFTASSNGVDDGEVDMDNLFG